MTSLFDPIQVGALSLPNRVFMAPLTRSRAGDSRVPNALMAEQYAQRASAGLILTEATSISPQGVGYAGTPGIWNNDQVTGWRQVTEAVHAKGGHIVMQLWHVGRISHSSFLNGELPVAPSAIAAGGHVSLVRPVTAFETPRPLDASELPGIVADYRRAAENAKAAGFDGVQVHGANGYLIDQFLQDSTNKRDDDYGGSIENRARLALEVVDACIDVWGADRVGMHLSPRGDLHTMGDSDPLALFTYVASELGKRGIAFIAARESLGDKRIGPALKKAFGGVYVANEKFTGETAQQVIDAGEADAVAFGVPFIANPDLPARLKAGAPLNAPRPDLFYSPGAEGYTDYPTLA
jgi:2,4-dienoyl-CoA reductase-like NADH-dependent reductase (Old Yellow Enzyme family)